MKLVTVLRKAMVAKNCQFSSISQVSTRSKKNKENNKNLSNFVILRSENSLMIFIVHPEQHSKNIMQTKMRRFNKKEKILNTWVPEHLNQRVSTIYAATKFVDCLFVCLFCYYPKHINSL